MDKLEILAEQLTAQLYFHHHGRESFCQKIHEALVKATKDWQAIAERNVGKVNALESQLIALKKDIDSKRNIG